MKDLAPPRSGGPVWKAIVVGGPQDIMPDIRSAVKPFGIEIPYQWEGQKIKQHKGSFPKDVDLAIILKDLNSHENISQAVKIAKNQNIPFVRTIRKKVTMLQSIRQHGFSQYKAEARANEFSGRQPAWKEKIKEERQPEWVRQTEEEQHKTRIKLRDTELFKLAEWIQELMAQENVIQVTVTPEHIHIDTKKENGQ